ncbi:MAG: cellobiose phosphorylase [Candidatus Omnitrophica bacterium]|nr:cellobiose phosphorylase [Candidatus Omnitrophota bacterium]
MICMKFRFLDDTGAFHVPAVSRQDVYFPLTNRDGTLLSAVSPQLAGDIKRDQDHFVTPPATAVDLRANLLCRREVFFRVEEQGKTEIVRFSSLGSYEIEAGILFHRTRACSGPLSIEVLNFIPYADDAEVMRVTVQNQSDRKITITPLTFLPLYGRSAENVRDHRHVSSLLNRIRLLPHGIMLQPTMVFDEHGHRKNTRRYYCLGYQEDGRGPSGQFPTLDSFLGEGDMLRPGAVYEEGSEAVKEKLCTHDGKEACGGFEFSRRELAPGAQFQLVILTGTDAADEEVPRTFEKFNSPEKVETALEETKTYWNRCVSETEFSLGDPEYSNWVRWVKLQPTLRKLFGCSFLPHFDYGKGGRGWRDLWQDALSLLFTEEAQAGELILHNFHGVRIDGSNATIITRDGQFLSDRNKISRVWMDHGVWPLRTLSLYVHKTGDLDLLLREVPYFRDHQRKRARAVDPGFDQSDFVLRNTRGEKYAGTVLEHLLIQNLAAFFHVGAHNVIRLENADWNDGLDMAREKGESVAFSFMYAYNLRQLAELIETLSGTRPQVELCEELLLLLDTLEKPVEYGSFRARQQRAEEYFDRTCAFRGKKVPVETEKLAADLRAKSEFLYAWLNEHEWNEAGFYNGYYDNTGAPVDKKLDGNVQVRLESQVFALLSEGVPADRARRIWETIRALLYDLKLDGYRLNTDRGGLYLELGRAYGFAYGEKENGAVFNHMVVMLAHALYRCGFVQEGHKVFSSVYRMASSPRAEIYPVLPEYFNGEGRGLYLYLTGSASWYVYTLIEQVFGIQFSFGALRLLPRFLPVQYAQVPVSVRFKFHGKQLTVRYRRESADASSTKEPGEILRVQLQGRAIETAGRECRISKQQIEGLSAAEVTLEVILK